MKTTNTAHPTGDTMEEQPVGNLMDQLGVTLALEDGDFITDVIVTAKVSRADGTVTVITGKSEACTWYDQLALSNMGADIVGRQGWHNLNEEEA